MRFIDSDVVSAEPEAKKTLHILITPLRSRFIVQPPQRLRTAPAPLLNPYRTLRRLIHRFESNPRSGLFSRFTSALTARVGQL